MEIIEKENEKEESYDELTTISPEILRQRLLEIGSKVKAQYQGAPGFGASTNLLQVANIGIILQNESKTLDEALAMEEILSRIDRNSPLIEEQILSIVMRSMIFFLMFCGNQHLYWMTKG